MIRLFKKVQSKLGRVRKRLGPVFAVLVTALLVALFSFGISILFGVFEAVPQAKLLDPRTADVLWIINPPAVLFVTTFLLGALLGTWYFVYRPNRQTIHEHWAQIPTWIQATSLGLTCGLVVTIGLATINNYIYITDLTILASFLFSWPLGTGMVVLQNRCIGDDCPRTTSVRIGYTHAKGLESRTMAIILGAMVAVVGGLVTWLLFAGTTDGDFVLPVVGVAAILWMGVTVLVYNRYDAQTAEQTDLEIVEVNRPDTRTAWELTIKNESNSTIDLSLAKVRDTKFELYRFGVDTNLGPGEVCTFNAPDDFRLAPNDDSWELPLGYTLKQGSETPAILTRTGEMYGLQRNAITSEDETGPEPVPNETESTSASGQSPGSDPAPQD